MDDRYNFSLHICRREEWKSKGEDEWVVGKGADVKFDHVRRTERTMGKCISRGKTETPIHPLLRRYTAAGPPFHATFTVLFYFEGYIFLDFIARLAPRNTRRRGDLLKFYTVPYLRARLCKMETARRIFLIDGWRG